MAQLTALADMFMESAKGRENKGEDLSMDALAKGGTAKEPALSLDEEVRMLRIVYFGKLNTFTTL